MASVGPIHQPHATTPVTLGSGESHHNQLSNSKKWRSTPAHLDRAASDDLHARVTQQSERVNRRESRLGFRSIFGRSKTGKAADIPALPSVPKAYANAPATTDLRAGAYSSPYSKAVAHTTVPLYTAAEDQERTGNNMAAAKPPAKVNRGHMASWDAPPLFKAYPQAVRYSTLPSCSTPADLLLKQQEKTPGTPEDEKVKPRRRHRRSKSGSHTDGEAKKKIYILVTAGYLLEYANDGPFDRLPEKVLKLNRHSAAFASDSIPGRHWVLQVASAMDSNGAVLPDTSRSIFSRLPFRGAPTTERRSTSNMLLIFESAEEMDEWLATIRRAIQALGGKKFLSETGKPKGEHAVPLRERASQRTLVVRDPELYKNRGAVCQSDYSWVQNGSDNRASVISFAMSDNGRDRSIDDFSTTNSVTSHDGQQLESLRNSSNRLSYVSSGQRTMVTSTTSSSPACSPTVDSFPSGLEDIGHYTLDTNTTETRMRFNGSVIADRRQSLQPVHPFAEVKGGQPGQRPLSTTFSPTDSIGPLSAGSPAPNFSVPSSRRFSTRISTFETGSPSTTPRDIEMMLRIPSRRPPTTSRVSRPLSMVEDQPLSSQRETFDQVEIAPSQSERGSVALDGQVLEFDPTKPVPSDAEFKLHKPPRNAKPPSGPRRLASLGSLGKTRESFYGADASVEPNRMRSLRSAPLRSFEMEPSLSTFDRHQRGGAFASLPSRVAKRSSMLPFVPAFGKPESISEPPAPPPTIPLPPVPIPSHIKAEAKALALQNRRSMPQLADGPPPAPPPTCALPPIPQQISQKLHVKS
ncbi:unnamed protein product [Clonostachys chloroleuca]|uniref:PH domain-containing protein n=1 Tax=Clonostachys chloroleuca TaxID=1926264 RepID=A0AA35M3J2_9HYPO|nr:unnamed protein product [Clonostachys chloroleuca]